MNNGVMGMMASPFDMLLGFGTRVPTRGQAGPGDFGQLLGMFPQMPNMESVLPGQMPVPALSPETQLVAIGDGEVPLGLPRSLIRELLPQALMTPEQTAAAMMPTGTPPPVLATGEVLAAEQDGDHMLFLKIRPETLVDEPMMAPSMEAVESGDAEEMLIPMRLRTVEMQGGQLKADADLLTATGKQISVRLTIPVAGNLQGMEKETLLPAAGLDAAPQASAKPDMVGLLQKLGVTQIIVEPAVESVPMTMSAALTGAVKPTMLRDPRFSQLSRAGVPTATAPTGLAIESESVRMPVPGITAADGSTEFIESFSGGFDKFDATATTMTTADVKAAAFAASSADASTPSAGPTTAETLPAAKFYDLDFGLEQLKQNPGQKIRVQLMPSQLGKMELSIASHRGTVTVNLVVDSMQAKQAVERGLGQLERQLSSSGLRVDGFQIHVSDSARQQGMAGHHQHFQHGGYRGGYQGRGSQQHSNGRYPGRQYAAPEAGFERIMVNYLA